MLSAVGRRHCSELLPRTHSFRAFLKSSGERVIARTEQRLAAFRSARVYKFNRSHEAFPALGEHFSNFLLPRQCIWNREIVLSENPPNLASCEQVSRVVNWAQYLS